MACRSGALGLIDSTSHIRVARPSRDLASAGRFYTDGLGLEVLWRTTERTPGKHDLLMAGPPGGSWHFDSPTPAASPASARA
ncbi:VOC family protein [Streptomyces sp. NPDC056930]|uniref:VOC family protein n=1 Tax=Streptomyces sp. NPDC056930 TaxID=3345967 RepID=UPI003639E9D9